MPTISPTLTVVASGSDSVLLFDTGIDPCQITLSYVQDQFIGFANNSMYLRGDYVAPPGLCFPRQICLHPAKRFDTTRDGFAEGPDGAFNESEGYLQYQDGQPESQYIAVGFNISIDKPLRIGWLRLRVLSGTVDDGIIHLKCRDTFPSNASDNSNGFASRSVWATSVKQSILTIDVKNDINLLIDSYPNGTFPVYVCFMIRFDTLGTGTASAITQFASSRNLNSTLIPTLTIA